MSREMKVVWLEDGPCAGRWLVPADHGHLETEVLIDGERRTLRYEDTGNRGSRAVYSEGETCSVALYPLWALSQSWSESW